MGLGLKAKPHILDQNKSVIVKLNSAKIPQSKQSYWDPRKTVGMLDLFYPGLTRVLLSEVVRLWHHLTIGLKLWENVQSDKLITKQDYSSLCKNPKRIYWTI